MLLRSPEPNPGSSGTRARRVCIIGAGASGIAMAKEMIDRGVDFDCLERAPRVGGLWREGDDSDTVAYRSLHINSSKRQMQFSDHAMPEAYPDFPSRLQIAEYLAGYARKFGVTDRVEVGRSVSEVKPLGNGRWEVRIGERDTRIYDAVLVASGYNSRPKLPENAGHGFGGEIMHSHAVRAATPFEGRNVLVVGFGNSAVDIASLVSTTAARTYISTRRGAHVVPKYMFGRPFDELPAPRWPRRLRWGTYGLATRLSAGQLERYHLPKPDHRFGRAAVTISSDLLARIAHGKVLPRPAVAQLHDRSVTFENGLTDPLDTIIYCTGYEHTTPFLEQHGLDAASAEYRLFEQIWDPRFKGLAHIGLVQPLGSAFPIFETQAKILTDWVTREYALPETSLMEESIDRAQRRRDRRYVPSQRHILQVDEPDYSNGLERERKRGNKRAAKRRKRESSRGAAPGPTNAPEGSCAEVAL